MSTLEEHVTLSDEQRSVCQSLEIRRTSFFITGKAGTGKSVLLRFLSSIPKRMWLFRLRAGSLLFMAAA